MDKPVPPQLDGLRPTQSWPFRPTVRTQATGDGPPRGTARAQPGFGGGLGLRMARKGSTAPKRRVPISVDEPLVGKLEPAAADTMPLARRLWAKLAVSLALGALFAWLAARGGLPLIPSAEAFVDVRWEGVAGYVLSLLLVHYFRAARWRFLIAPFKPLPLREVILVNWVGFFAIFALPLRLGELARPALCKAREQIPISVGFGTVAVERVVDGFVTSCCVAWALFALARRAPADLLARHLPSYGYASLALFSCAFAALGMFLWQRRLAVNLVQRTLGWVSPDLGRFLAGKVSNMVDGLRCLSNGRLAVGFAAETLAYWSINALGVWRLGVACGLPMGLGHAVALMGVLAIGILLPTGPGLFGNFQLAVSVTLKLYFASGVIGDAGAAFVFLLYVCQAGVMLLAGVVPLYTMRIRFRDMLSVRA